MPSVGTFPDLAKRLREVQLLLSRLPWDFEEPAALPKLQSALEQCLHNPRQTRLTVQAVMRRLDALRDGLTTLQALETEVRDTTVEALRDAHTVVTRMASQLEGLGIQATNVEAAATRVRDKLESSAPWRGLSDLEGDLEEIRIAYRSERSKLLQEQEQRLEASRQKVRGFNGYSTLGADQSHAVLKPLAACANSTDEEAIAPSLEELKDPFVARLQRAEREAGETLDRLLVDKGEVTVTQQVDLGLHNRELNSEEDVRALQEIESRLLRWCNRETVCGFSEDSDDGDDRSRRLSARSVAAAAPVGGFAAGDGVVLSPLGAGAGRGLDEAAKTKRSASTTGWMNR